MKKIVFLLGIVCLLSGQLPAGSKLDSLQRLLAQRPANDSAKVFLLLDIFNELWKEGKTREAKRIIEHSLRIADSLKLEKGWRRSQMLLANVLRETGDYPGALKVLFEVLRAMEKGGKKGGLGNVLLNIGNTYCYQGDYDQGLIYFRRTYATAMEAKDLELSALSIQNLAATFNARQELDSAEKYYKISLMFYEKSGIRERLALVYSNLGALYHDRKNEKKSLEFSYRALNLYKKIGDKFNQALQFTNIGSTLVEQRNFSAGLPMLDTGYALAKETASSIRILQALEALARGNVYKGDYRKALFYKESFIAEAGRIFNEENHKDILEMEASYELEKKQEEIELLNKDKKIRALTLLEHEDNAKRNRFFIFSILGGLLIVGTLLFLILREYSSRKKINVMLSRLNAAISARNRQIEEKNRLIADSFEYAREIQNAALPAENDMSSVLPESFILFLQGEPVSRNFYWVKEVHGRAWFASGTCSGPGVEGAFLSVMIVNRLEELVRENQDASPQKILGKLNGELSAVLHRKGLAANRPPSEKITLCCLDTGKETTRLEFAGIRQALYRVSEVRIDKIETENFPDKSMQELQKGDSVYLISGSFLSGNAQTPGEIPAADCLTPCLPGLHLLAPGEQRSALAEKIQQLSKEGKQFDDMLVLGVKI